MQNEIILLNLEDDDDDDPEDESMVNSDKKVSKLTTHTFSQPLKMGNIFSCFKNYRCPETVTVFCV